MSKVKCPICNKEVDSQGYGGHLFIAHQKKVGIRAEIEELKRKIKLLEKEWNRRFEALKRDMKYDQKHLYQIYNEFFKKSQIL